MRPSDVSGLSNLSQTKHKILFSRANTADSIGMLIEQEHETTNTDYIMPYYPSGSFSLANSDIFSFPDATTTNYYLFCIGFSLTAAPIVSTLIFAPPMIGHVTGGIGNGVLFLTYALCSLVFAKPTVSVLGSTRSFIVGHGGNFVYVVGFLFFSQGGYSMNRIAYPVLSAIGGMAQGIMWAAQSKYFSKNVAMMVSSMDVKEVENMNRSLATKFAFLYFLCVAIILLICTVFSFNILHMAHDILYGIIPAYVVLTLISLLLLSYLDTFGDVGDSWINFKPRRGFAEMLAAAAALPPAKRLKLALIIPYHVAWGICTSYWIYYALGVIVLNQKGIQYIGVASVIDLTVSVLFTKVSNFITKRLGQFPIVVWGAACITTMGLIIILVNNRELGHNRRLVGYTIIHGMARAVYENNMKAVTADFFPEHEPLAFSFTGFAKTFACGVSYLVYALVLERKERYGLVVTTAGGVAIIGYLWGLRKHAKEKVDGYDSLRSMSVSAIETESDTSLMYVAEYF